MIRRAFGVLLAAVLCATPAIAQEITGAVSGTVVDSSKAAIPGATIKLEGGSVNQLQVSDGNGRYTFAALPPGTYKMTTTLSGFSTSLAENVVVAIGKTTTIDFALNVGGVAEQVTVEADAARIDTAQSTIQTNVTAATIENLPKGTNMTSLLKLAPAARQEALSGGFQIDGASGSENSFMIDGLETGNFRTGVLNVNNNLPFEFIQEMSIKTSGFNAEFGGATGGVISVVTKSGTNQFRGMGGIEFEPSSLAGDPRGRLNSFGTGTGASFVQVNEYLNDKQDDYTNVFPVFGLGGPILRDKVWFFASYSPQIFNETRTTEYFTSDPRTRTKTGEETYERTRKSEYFQGRVDAQPTNTLRLTGTWTYNPYTEDGLFPHNQISLGNAPPSVNFGGSTGILTGSDLTTQQGGKQDGYNYSFGGTWTPNGRMVISSRAARGYLNELLNSEMIPQETRFRCITNATPAGAGCSVGFDSFPSNSQRFEDSSERWTVDSNIAFLVDDLAGRHEFKVGHQYSRVANDVNTGYVPYGIVSLTYGVSINDLTGRNDPLTPGAIGAGVVQRFGTVGAAANTANSLYFQDRWQPTSRLTINAGVRMEKEDLPSFNGYAPPINFGWGDKIVPRLGAAYDLTGDGRTKLFGSYNKFQDRLKFELPRGSFGGDFFRNDYFEIMPNNPNYDFYTLNRILGSNQDVLGGQCPIPNSTGLSRCQYDFRIASNDPNADIYTGKVDPDLEPFTQSEFTAGLEREIARSMVLSVRYTRKSVENAVEDAGFPTAEGSEAYIIGNPGSGLHAATASAVRLRQDDQARACLRRARDPPRPPFLEQLPVQPGVHVQQAPGQLLGSRELGRERPHLTRCEPLLRPAAPRLHRRGHAGQRRPGDRSSARVQRERLVPVQLGLVAVDQHRRLHDVPVRHAADQLLHAVRRCRPLRPQRHGPHADVQRHGPAPVAPHPLRRRVEVPVARDERPQPVRRGQRPRLLEHAGARQPQHRHAGSARRRRA